MTAEKKKPKAPATASSPAKKRGQGNGVKSAPSRPKPKQGKRQAGGGRGSKPMRWILLSLLGLLVAILAYFTFRVIADNAFNIKARFGKVTYPAGDIRGIDISHYQQEIDWDRLRNANIDGVPVSFMLIKATEGSNIIDEYFNQNFFQAREAGIRRGAYHFLTTSSDALQQARFYCRVVQLEGGDIAPVLDVERRDGMPLQQLQKHVLTWMNYVEQHYGITPILYTSYKFRTDYLNTPEFDRYPLWIAHYYVERLRYKGKWAIWQHTDQGSVDGIKGDVDLNVLNGTRDDLEQLLLKH